MGNTAIEWADRVWNPITGCSKVSEGCQNCYAERFAKRLAGRAGYYPVDPFRPTFHQNRIDDPHGWSKPQRVFVNSMGDLFHELVPWEWVASVFNVMGAYPQHTFLILTKRPKMMEEFIGGYYGVEHSNVWLGVTAENRRRWNERVPVLRQVSAAARFVSVEPMLESLGDVDLSGIDWVIAGAETGAGKRPMQLVWALDLAQQCDATGTAFFFKKDSQGRHELHGRVWEQFPQGRG